MYETYWQLTQKPFENSADPRFYFPGESHQAALLKLRYAIENRRGGALLAGVSGSGKTLVANMLRETVDASFRPFLHLVFPQMSTVEMLGWLADGLAGSPTATAAPSVQESVYRIEKALTENTRQGRHAVVVIDEAHLIDDPRTLEAMRLLMNFETGGQPGLTLLLVGQTGILPTLQRMPQLDERLGVKCLLRAFTPRETGEYITHRLKVAGAAQPIVQNEAFPVLHGLTHGVARRINRLCDLALLIGYAEERKTLTSTHFESVADELVAVTAE